MKLTKANCSTGSMAAQFRDKFGKYAGIILGEAAGSLGFG